VSTQVPSHRVWLPPQPESVPLPSDPTLRSRDVLSAERSAAGPSESGRSGLASRPDPLLPAVLPPAPAIPPEPPPPFAALPVPLDPPAEPPAFPPLPATVEPPPPVVLPPDPPLALLPPEPVEPPNPVEPTAPADPPDPPPLALAPASSLRTDAAPVYSPTHDTVPSIPASRTKKQFVRRSVLMSSPFRGRVPIVPVPRQVRHGLVGPLTCGKASKLPAPLR
jgi:hypothetical protein